MEIAVDLTALGFDENVVCSVSEKSTVSTLRELACSLCYGVGLILSPAHISLMIPNAGNTMQYDSTTDGDIPLSETSLVQGSSVCVLRCCRTFFEGIVSHNIQYCKESLPDWAWNDLDLVRSVLEHCAHDLANCPSWVLEDPNLVEVAVSEDGMLIVEADVSLRKNRQVVSTAVSQNGMALQYADKTLCDDIDIVLIAVSQAGAALQFASPRLRACLEVVSNAVKQNGGALRYVPVESGLLGDKELVLKAVSHVGWALRYAEESVRDDKEVVSAAISQCAWALESASERLQDDVATVLLAAEQNPLTLRCASRRVITHEKLAAAVKARSAAKRSTPHKRGTIKWKD